MYLKSIELAGFKSFTGRTKIKLEEGVSCIVGPNGSGKSNIADAIRWVLGEQSARILRGHRMEDVIFSGSDKLKPLGMAEVVLNIDNSDGSLPVEFSEISVCRRAYRNGDSEYLMNGRQCRLSDIKEMFMDSGVGNSSLALIGQGRIQEIVNMKAEERRSLLEEAAGIVKYRTRKKTAERKLADTEQNLARLWDIISELAARLEPLAGQSRRAEEYLRLKADADRQEINLLLQGLKADKEALAENTSLLGSKSSELAEVDTERTGREAELIQLKLAQDTAEEELTALRQSLFDLRTMKEQAEARETLFNEKINAAGANIERLHQELNQLLSRDDGFVAEVDRLEQQREVLGAELAGLDEQIAGLTADLAVRRELLEELAAEQEQARQEIFDNASQLTNTRNEHAYLIRALEESFAALESLRQEQAAAQSENSEITRRITACEGEINELAGRRQQNKAALVELEAGLNELEAENLAAKEADVALRMKLNSEQSRLKVFAEMAENRSGFYPGVRAITRAAAQGTVPSQGVHGVVLDLIESDMAYSMALEAAAGAALQNIVVSDDGVARRCVEYLKKEKLGRATFLPLKSLRWRENRELTPALGQPGVIGRCSDVIRCADEVRPAVEFLFANTLLVNDLQVATGVARAHNQQFRIVTLDGDIISPGGSITGGSRQKNTGDLLQKKNQLAGLKNSVARLEQECAAARQRVDALQHRRDELSRQRDSLLIQDRELELQYLGRVKDITYLRDTLEEKQRRGAQIERDIAESGREQQRMQRRIAELADEIANWEDVNRRSNELLVDTRQRLEAEQQAAEQVRGHLEQQRLLAAEKRQTCNTLQSEAERLRSEKNDLFAEKERKERDIAAWQQQMAELTGDKQQNRQRLVEYAAAAADTEDSLNERAANAAGLKSGVEECEQRIAALGHTAAVLQQEIHRLELKGARLQAEEEAGTQKLAESFELTYEDALEYLDTGVAESELRHNVRELRRCIAALGSINLDAIEEYRQVRERHEFLSAQRGDLLAARDQLHKVIREMDGIMVRRFRETFDMVNQNFGQTFNRLFGGGSGSLLLTDPEDLLTTGVDMVVQPPGKRLINYNLLSGGEKSLVGIALVLAVFQVKPSPFCVMDEVDAALDEANVDRLAEYIKAFKSKTQFVIVSHRQGTMEAADRLWGVTMEKDGVSRMVSVKLSDNLEEFIS